MSSITTRPATHDDIPRMLEVFFSAFSSSPLNERCFPPSSQEVQDWQENLIQRNIDNKDDNYMIVAEQDSCILGWARWARREQPLPGKQIKRSTFPTSGDQETARHFFQANNDAAIKYIAGEKHWFLSTIAVAKEGQRRGVGSALMKFGVEKADEEGWMSYLNSSQEGKGLYGKFGFKVSGTSEFPELGMVQYHMRRESVKS
ncbi:puromycin n-acetyltransferase [Fusarium sporotrichioides]|uniref:Puromycin n-acetyltransferase n=1 Tax=Fusarium sporotrichioides TaxID=5514 RepID=A0A395S7E2_FUSSP|nr:puromycin n-acetyltransferase [Fusarium sporotrichioides]